MTKKIADTSHRFVIEVSEREKQTAKEVKVAFKELLNKLEDSLALLYDFKDSVVKERPSQDDLKNKYNGRILRYKRKIVLFFNDLLYTLKAIIEKLSGIMDPEMRQLRSLIMAEFDELSDGVEGFIDALKNPGKDDFTKNIERIITQLKRRKTSIGEVIDHQMMGHLENDILGKMKVSSLKARMIKRSRLVWRKNV